MVEEGGDIEQYFQQVKIDKLPEGRKPKYQIGDLLEICFRSDDGAASVMVASMTVGFRVLASTEASRMPAESTALDDVVSSQPLKRNAERQKRVETSKDSRSAIYVPPKTSL